MCILEFMPLGCWGKVFCRRTKQELYTLTQRPHIRVFNHDETNGIYYICFQSPMVSIWKVTEKEEVMVFDKPVCCADYSEGIQISKTTVTSACSVCWKVRQIGRKSREQVWELELTFFNPAPDKFHFLLAEQGGLFIASATDGWLTKEIILIDPDYGKIIEMDQEKDVDSVKFQITKNFIFLLWIKGGSQWFSIQDRITSMIRTFKPDHQTIPMENLQNLTIVQDNILVMILSNPPEQCTKIVIMNLDAPNPVSSMRVIHDTTCYKFFNIQPDGFVVVSGNCCKIQISKLCFPTLGETLEEVEHTLFGNQILGIESNTAAAGAADC